MPKTIISAEVEPQKDKKRQAAKLLEQKGFRVLHIGTTISVQGPQALWEKTFGVSFELQTQTAVAGLETTKMTYPKPLSGEVRIPEELQPLILSVSFSIPPEFV